MKLDDQPHEIIGVMPSSLEILTTRVDAWAPLPADRAAFYDRLNSVNPADALRGDR